MSVYGFRFSFTPLTGVLFAFPSRYLSAIGSCSVFSLGSWSTRILTGFHVPRHTQDTAEDSFISDTRLSRSLTLLPRSFSYSSVFTNSYRSPTTPLMRFGLLPVRSPLLGESLLISFPGLLRWFTSPSVASVPYLIRIFGWRSRLRRVAPFGNPGIKGRSLLPLDFRGLPRPSSPDGPKASAMGLLSLGHIAPSARREKIRRAQGLLRFLFVFPSLVVSKSGAPEKKAPVIGDKGI